MARPAVRRILPIVLAAMSLSVSGAVATQANASPQSRYAAALVAARGERTVHYVGLVDDGTIRITFVGDVAVTEGIQHIHFVTGRGSGLLTTIVSSHRAWIRGDAFALAHFLDFTSAAAAKDAGRWIAVPPADYASTAAAVTLGSVIDELQLKGAVMPVSAQRIAGVPAFGVKGGSSIPGVRRATLYARASGPPLPIEQVGTGGGEAKITLSRWNEQVHVSPPAHAITGSSQTTPAGPAVTA
ncbi:MAG TPA: hypothetical protein VGM80_06575 [Gaiellaceae bacterium]|jgi:hypothetical protein